MKLAFFKLKNEYGFTHKGGLDSLFLKYTSKSNLNLLIIKNI